MGLYRNGSNNTVDVKSQLRSSSNKGSQFVQVHAGDMGNNQMATLVLSPRQSEDSQILWRTALHAGWNIERAINWKPPIISDGGEIVVYGEPILARRLAERTYSGQKGTRTLFYM